MKNGLICAFVGLSLALSPVPVLSQDNGLKSVNAKGTIEDRTQYQLAVKGEDGQAYTVVLTPATRVEFSGTAERNMLTVGQFLRLDGKFDLQGNAEQPINAIEVFKPRMGARISREEAMGQALGIYRSDDELPLPESVNLANPAAMAKPTDKARLNDKAKPSSAEGKLFDDKQSKNKPNSKNTDKLAGNKSSMPDKQIGSAQAVGPFQTFRVVGRIINLQADRIQLNAGTQSLVIPLAENSTVNVRSCDLELCSKGDQIHFVGLSAAAQPNLVQADRIAITGAKPLGAELMQQNLAIANRASGTADGKLGSNSGNKTISKPGGKSGSKTLSADPPRAKVNSNKANQ